MGYQLGFKLVGLVLIGLIGVAGVKAQDDRSFVVIYSDSGMLEESWSSDSKEFIYSTEIDRYSNSPVWYTYHMATQQITTDDIHPVAAALPSTALPEFQIAEYAADYGSIFISPNHTYIVYPSNVRREPIGAEGGGGNFLGIANLKTGAHVITEIPIYSNMIVEWSDDESAFVVENTSPYAAPIIYYVSRLDETLSAVFYAQLDSTLRVEGYAILQMYDIDEAGDLIMAQMCGNDGLDKLMIWNPLDPAQNWSIEYPDGLKTAQFSVDDPNRILMVVENRLVAYEILPEFEQVSSYEIDIPSVRRALFSPNQAYVALITDENDNRVYIYSVAALGD
jgi:hypothetical protein